MKSQGRGKGRVDRTLAAVRARRIARFRMAHATRRAIPCVADIKQSLERGASAERLERARLELADIESKQRRLI